ncbi:MAG: hypothetical protein WA125_12245, partial [Desulfosporosinus sp.]
MQKGVILIKKILLFALVFTLCVSLSGCISSPCIYRDAGWGRLVARNKFTDGYFSDELVDAAAELINVWQPNPY